MSKRKHAIDAHFQSGVRLHGAGRLQEAQQVYRQIIAAYQEAMPHNLRLPAAKSDSSSGQSCAGRHPPSAALIDSLDLLIGVVTAVVHLAGALGKPVWLLNRYDTCWRWQQGRDDSPW